MQRSVQTEQFAQCGKKAIPQSGTKIREITLYEHEYVVFMREYTALDHMMKITLNS